MKKNFESLLQCELHFTQKFITLFFTIFVGITALITLISFFLTIEVKMFLNPFIHFLIAIMALMFLLSFITYEYMPPDYTIFIYGYNIEVYCKKYCCILKGNISCKIHRKKMKLTDEYGNRTPWLKYNNVIMYELQSSPLFKIEE